MEKQLFTLVGDNKASIKKNGGWKGNRSGTSAEQQR